MTLHSVADNLAHVRWELEQACLRCGRRTDSVRLLAVSKTHPSSAIREAYQCGQRLFGESYAQELRQKGPELADCPGLEFHFIGHVQSNKVRWVAQHAACVHSVHNEKLLSLLSAEATGLNKVIDVLFEVHLSPEEEKSGCLPEELPSLVKAAMALPGIRARGLMTMPPLDGDAESARPYFAELRRLREAVVAKTGVVGFDELSMGMSGDFEVAVQEGATMVRIGTAIFGAREYPA